MVTMTKAKPVSSPLNDQLAGFIELAKDPAAFSAKLAELKDAEEKAEDAIALAAARKDELDSRERDLAGRSDALARRVAQHENDTETLAKDRAAFDAERSAQAANLAELARSLNAREAEIAVRETDTSKIEKGVAALNRVAQQDRDAAAARLGEIKSVAALFDPIRAKLSALS